MSRTDNTKSKSMPPHHYHHHHQRLCTRTHQIGALRTFFFPKLFDHSFAPCTTTTSTLLRASQSQFFGPHAWPEQGYGSQLSLKIYVYDAAEIDGLNLLMYGREGKITEESCLKGQWGTQVKIHKLLLKSRYRTRNKDEADFLFLSRHMLNVHG
ncbi:hypothetical protein PIB30_100833 [Stylosanthes scabra]|uniref:Galectin n=1 Tax=Stylosanthes scabra TaxID=79078 RepID=A0ABU6YZ55_9FABA|nr:hypothetical protein [Stylosanthes scabra]